MKIDIEQYSKNEGEKIAKVIFSKYGDEPTTKHNSVFKAFLDGLLNGAVSKMKVESEIYGSALHIANVFFSKNSDMKSSTEIIQILRSRLSTSLERPKEIKKLEPEEMLANLIKIEALNFLLSKGVVY